MIRRKAGQVHYLEAESLASTGVAVNGFSTRHEGISRPPYNSLNLGLGTQDYPHSVEGNRSVLTRALGSSSDRLVTVTQVHGLDILAIDSANQEFGHFQRLECDGIITNQPGVMIGVCVADCVPVLLLDPVRRVAGAIHAGWKGTAGKISRKGVEAMIELFGSRPSDILAAIGPAIGNCCYQVDRPVRDAFCAGGTDWEQVATLKDVGHWSLDLVAANASHLREGGLSADQIELSGVCVSCSPELFFSYRRDGGDTGRQMGFIMLKDQ